MRIHFPDIRTIQRELGQIHWWIVLFFILGLENITNPPLDDHSWRQTLTISISKNLMDYPNPFYPRMDIGGKTEGIIAGEFPIYNYFVTITYWIFGYTDWSGRLVNWLFSCVGLWFFYGLIKKLTNSRVAFYSAVAFMASITFQFARKTMPDTFSLSLVFAGTFYAWTYLENHRTRDLILSFILISLGLLSKVPSIVIICFLIVPFMRNEYKMKNKINVGVAIGISAIIMCIWLFYWMPHLLEHYKNQLIWPVSLSEGWEIMNNLSYDVWERFRFFAFSSRVPFILAVAGLGALVVRGERQILLCSLAYSVLFFLFILKTGAVFPNHNYYVIPYTPLMAFFIGYLFANSSSNFFWPLTILLLMLFPSFSANRKASFNPFENRYLLRLEEIVNKYVNKSDKVMVNNGMFNPTLMFYTRRKGWTVNQDVVSKVDWMPDFKRDGLKYIVIDRHLLNDTLPFSLVYEDQDFRIYKP
ncbi:MAG: glycosyltransferase family 39 protein [Saprospiraceae bacterium]|nr:glycosyltransferase family 39 protein [Saprospiraceae bacterium]